MASEDKSSVLSWPKRVAQSIAFGAIDAVKEKMPITFSTIENNKETVKKLYQETIGSRQHLQKLKNIQDTYIFKPSKELLKNLKSDIKSGVFYHPERVAKAEEESMQLMMESLLKEAGMEDMMGMLTGEEEVTDAEAQEMPITPVAEMTSGDAFVASTVAQEQRYATNALAKVQSDIADAQMHAYRTFGNLQMRGMQRQTNLLEHGFGAVIQGFNNIADFHENVLFKHIENSTQYYESMTKLTQENNAILKEMVDMKRNQYKAAQNPEESEDPNKPPLKSALFKNGVFDLSTYVKIVESNASSALVMLNMLPAMVQGFISGIIANPMHYLSKQAFSTMLGPGLRLAMSKFDRSISSYLSMGLAKIADFGANPKNGILQVLGQLFGVRTDTVDLNRTMIKDIKQPRSWDGEDHFYLTKVIPSYLSNIESALTGNDARLFNSSIGKFTTTASIAEKVSRAEQTVANSNTAELRNQIENVLFSTLNITPDDTETIRKFRDALNEFSVGMQRNNGLKNGIKEVLTNKDYGSNENMRRLIHAALVAIKGYDMSSDVRAGGNIISYKQQEAERRLKGSMNELSDDEINIAMGIDKQFRNGIGYSLNSNAFIKNPLTSSETDNKIGNSMIAWQEKIYNVLVDIRDYGTMGSGGGGILSSLKSIIPFMGNTTPGEKAAKKRLEDEIKRLKREEKKKRKERDERAKRLEQNETRKVTDMVAISGDHLDPIELVQKYNGDWHAFLSSTDFYNNMDRYYQNGEQTEEYKSLKNAFEHPDDLDKVYGGQGEWDQTRQVKMMQEQGRQLNIRTSRTYRASQIESNEAASKALAQHIMDQKDKLGSVLKEQELWSERGVLDNFFGVTKSKEDIKQKIRDAGGDVNKSILENLAIKSLTFSQRVSLISAGIDQLANSPRTILTTVLAEADKMMYEFMFGKDTGEKDKDGSPIHGLFGKMSSKMSEAAQDLNLGISKVVDNLLGFQEKWWDKGLNFLEKTFDFNPRRMWTDLKEQGVQFFNPFFDNAKEGSKSFLSELGGSLSATVRDIGDFFQYGSINRRRHHRAHGTEYAGEGNGELAIVSKGESILYPKYNPFNKNRDAMPDYGSIGIPKVEKTGLTYLPQGSAVLPSNINPWNPNRETARPEQDALNENRVQEQLDSKMSSYASGIDIVQDIAGKSKGALTHVLKNLDAEDASLLINGLMDTMHIKKDDVTGLLGSIAGFGAKDLSEYIAASDKDKEIAEVLFKLLWKSKAVMNNPTLKSFLKSMATSAGYKGNLETDDEILYEEYNQKEGMINGTKQFLSQMFGKDPGKALEETRKYVIHNTPEMMKGGMAGALAGTLFPLGGPLIGALGGVVTSLLANNKSFMEYVFGKEVVDENGKKTRDDTGLISQKFIKSLQKYIPDAKKYGITGSLVGLITPFGPLGGLMAGFAASYIKNNEAANRFLFGGEEDSSSGLFSKDLRNKIKRAMPNIGAATLGALFLGPFGLVGNAALGAGIGYLSTMESFKKIMLGSKDKNGIRHGGLAGAIRRHITNPLKRNFKGWVKDIGKWLKQDLVRPISRAVGPIGRYLGNAIKSGVSSLWYRITEKIAGPGSLFEKAFNGFFFGVKKAGGFGKFLAEQTIGRAGRWIGKGFNFLGDLARAQNYKKGNSGTETAAEVLANMDRMNSSDAQTYNMYHTINQRKTWDPNVLKEDAKLAEALALTFSHKGRMAIKERQSQAYGQLTSGISELTINHKELENMHNDLIDIADELRDAKTERDLDKALDNLKYTLKDNKITGDIEKEVLKLFFERSDEIREAKIAEQLRDSGNLETHKAGLENLKKLYGFQYLSDYRFINEGHLDALTKALSNEVKLSEPYLNESIEQQKEHGQVADVSVIQGTSTEQSRATAAYQRSITNGVMMTNELLATGLHGFKPGFIEQTMKYNQDFQQVRRKISSAIQESQNIVQKQKRDYENETAYNDTELAQKALAIHADKTIENLDMEHLRQTIGVNNRKYAATFLRLNEAKKLGNKAVIKDLETIIKLDTSKDGKLFERIGLLTIEGLTVPVKQYSVINDLSDVGFDCALKLVELGVAIGDFGLFKKFDKNDKYLADIMIRIAEDKYNLKDENGDTIETPGANFLTAEVIARNMNTNEMISARAEGPLGSRNYIEKQMKDNPTKFKTRGYENGLHMVKKDYGASRSRIENIKKIDEKDSEVSALTGEYQGISGIIQKAGRKAIRGINYAVDKQVDIIEGAGNLLTGKHKAGSKFVNAFYKVKEALKDSQYRDDQLETITARLVYGLGQDHINDALKFYGKAAYKVAYDLIENPDHAKKYKKLLTNHPKDFSLADPITHPEKIENYVDQIIAGKEPEDITYDPDFSQGHIIAPDWASESSLVSLGGEPTTRAFGTKYAGVKNIPKYAGGSLATAFNAIKNGGLGYLIGSSGDKKKEDNKDSKESQETETLKESSVNSITKAMQSVAGMFSASTASFAINNNNTPLQTEPLESDNGTKIVSTPYGPLQIGQSSADGQPSIIYNKANAEVLAKERHDIETKNKIAESISEMKDVFKDNLGGFAKKTGKKVGGGLLDLFKSVVSLPGDILSSLAGALFAIPLIGPLIMGILSPIKNLFGKFADKIFGTAENAAKNVGKEGAKTASKAVGTIMRAIPGPIKLIFAGLAAFFGYNLLSPSTAYAATENAVNGEVDENGNPITNSGGNGNGGSRGTGSSDGGILDWVFNNKLISGAGLALGGSALYNLIGSKVNTSLSGTQLQRNIGNAKLNSPLNKIEKFLPNPTKFLRERPKTAAALALLTPILGAGAKMLYDDYGFQTEFTPMAYNAREHGFERHLNRDAQDFANRMKKDGTPDKRITEMLKNKIARGENIFADGPMSEDEVLQPINEAGDAISNQLSSTATSSLINLGTKAVTGYKSGTLKHSLYAGTAKTMYDIAAGNKELDASTAGDLAKNIAQTHVMNKAFNYFWNASNAASGRELRELMKADEFLLKNNPSYVQEKRKIVQKYSEALKEATKAGDKTLIRQLNRSMDLEKTNLAREYGLKHNLVTPLTKGGKLIKNVSDFGGKLFSSKTGKAAVAAGVASTLYLQANKAFASDEEKKRIERQEQLEEEAKAKKIKELEKYRLKDGQKLEETDNGWVLVNKDGIRIANVSDSEKEKYDEAHEYFKYKGNGSTIDRALTAWEEASPFGAVFSRDLVGHMIGSRLLRSSMIGGTGGTILAGLISGKDLDQQLVQDAISDSIAYKLAGRAWELRKKENRKPGQGYFSAALDDWKGLWTKEYHLKNIENMRKSLMLRYIPGIGIKEAPSIENDTSRRIGIEEATKLSNERFKLLNIIEEATKKDASFTNSVRYQQLSEKVKQIDEVFKANGIETTEIQSDYEEKIKRQEAERERARKEKIQKEIDEGRQKNIENTNKYTQERKMASKHVSNYEKIEETLRKRLQNIEAKEEVVKSDKVFVDMKTEKEKLIADKTALEEELKKELEIKKEMEKRHAAEDASTKQLTKEEREARKTERADSKNAIKGLTEEIRKLDAKIEANTNKYNAELAKALEEEGLSSSKEKIKARLAVTEAKRKEKEKKVQQAESNLKGEEIVKKQLDAKQETITPKKPTPSPATPPEIPSEQSVRQATTTETTPPKPAETPVKTEAPTATNAQNTPPKGTTFTELYNRNKAALKTQETMQNYQNIRASFVQPNSTVNIEEITKAEQQLKELEREKIKLADDRIRFGMSEDRSDKEALKEITDKQAANEEAIKNQKAKIEGLRNPTTPTAPVKTEVPTVTNAQNTPPKGTTFTELYNRNKAAREAMQNYQNIRNSFTRPATINVEEITKAEQELKALERQKVQIADERLQFGMSENRSDKEALKEIIDKQAANEEAIKNQKAKIEGLRNQTIPPKPAETPVKTEAGRKIVDNYNMNKRWASEVAGWENLSLEEQKRIAAVRSQREGFVQNYQNIRDNYANKVSSNDIARMQLLENNLQTLREVPVERRTEAITERNQFLKSKMNEFINKGLSNLTDSEKGELKSYQQQIIANNKLMEETRKELKSPEKQLERIKARFNAQMANERAVKEYESIKKNINKGPSLTDRFKKTSVGKTFTKFASHGGVKSVAQLGTMAAMSAGLGEVIGATQREATDEEIMQRELAPGLSIVKDEAGELVVVDAEGNPLEDQSAVDRIQPIIPPGTEIIYDAEGHMVLVDEKTREPVEDQSPVKVDNSIHAYHGAMMAKMGVDVGKAVVNTMSSFKKTEKAGNAIKNVFGAVSDKVASKIPTSIKDYKPLKSVSNTLYKTYDTLNTAANAAKNATKAMKETAKAAETGGKAAMEAAENAGRIQTILAKAKEVIHSVINGISHLCPSNLLPAVKEMGKKILEAMAKPEFMQKILKAVAKQAGMLAAGAATAGIATAALSITFAVLGFYEGWNHSEDLLKIPVGKATTGMKLFCAIIRALESAPAVGLFILVLNETGGTVKILTKLGITELFGFNEQTLSDLRKEDKNKETSDEGYKSFDEAAKAFSSEGMLTWIKKSATGVVSSVVSAASEAASVVSTQASKAMEGISDLAGKAKEYVANKSAEVGKTIINGAKNGVDWIKEKASAGFQTAKEMGSKAIDMGKELLGDVGNFFTSLVPDPATLVKGIPNGNPKGKGLPEGYASQENSNVANMPIKSGGIYLPDMTVGKAGCGVTALFNAKESVERANLGKGISHSDLQAIASGNNPINSMIYQTADDGAHPEGLALLGRAIGYDAQYVDSHTAFEKARRGEGSFVGQIDGNLLTKDQSIKTHLPMADYQHYNTFTNKGTMIESSTGREYPIPPGMENVVTNTVFIPNNKGKGIYGKNKDIAQQAKDERKTKAAILAGVSKIVSNSWGKGNYGKATAEETKQHEEDIKNNMTTSSEIVNSPDSVPDKEAPPNLPFFRQWDSRYADKPYPGGSGSSIMNSGCGPTSLAMVATWATGKAHYPDTVAEWLGTHNYHTSSGTDGNGYSAYARENGFDFSHTTNFDDVIKALDQHKPVINSQGEGEFTKQGHIILLAGRRKDGSIIVYDPNKRDPNEGFSQEAITKSTAYGYWIPEGANLGNSSSAPVSTASKVANFFKGLFKSASSLTPEQQSRLLNQLVKNAPNGFRGEYDSDLLDGSEGSSPSRKNVAMVTDVTGLPLGSVAKLAAQYLGNSHPELLWAQMMHETGGPENMEKEKWQLNDHNYGGIKYYNYMANKGIVPSSVHCPASESGGATPYASFPDDESFVQEWTNTLSKYPGTSQASTPEEWAAALHPGDGGGNYYEDDVQNYASGIRRWLTTYSDKIENLGKGIHGKGFGKRGFLSNLWDGIKSTAKSMWDAIRTPFVRAYNIPSKSIKPIKEEKEKFNELTDIKAPNGTYVTKNDLDYLTNQGYSLESAKQLLFDHDKYKVKVKEELPKTEVQELTKQNLFDPFRILHGKGLPNNIKKQISNQYGKNIMHINAQAGDDCTLEATKAMYKAYNDEDVNPTFNTWANMMDQLSGHREVQYGDRESFEKDIKEHFDQKPSNPIFLYQTGGAGKKGSHKLNRGSGSHATVIARRTDDGKYDIYDSNQGIVHHLDLSEIYDDSAKGGVQNMDKGNALWIPDKDPSAPITEWQPVGTSASPGSSSSGGSSTGSSKSGSSKSKGLMGYIDSLIELTNIYSGIGGTDTSSNNASRNNSGSVTQSDAATEKIKKVIWDHLSSKYGKIAAAGIMGNMEAESSFNPKAVNPKGASGLCQWTAGRKTALQQFATEQNKDWTDIEAQLGYLDKEIDESYTNTIEKMKTQSLQDAAYTWALEFERPGTGASDGLDGSRKKREDSANNIFKQFGVHGHGKGFGKRGFLSNLWDGIKSTAKSMWDAIRTPFVRAYNIPSKSIKPIKEEKEKFNELTDIKAPNGTYVTKNDLDYLTNQGYSLESAKQLLFDHDKYKVKVKEELPKTEVQELTKQNLFDPFRILHGKGLPNNIKEDLINLKYMEPIQAPIEVSSKAGSFWNSVLKDEDKNKFGKYPYAETPSYKMDLGSNVDKKQIKDIIDKHRNKVYFDKDGSEVWNFLSKHYGDRVAAVLMSNMRTQGLSTAGQSGSFWGILGLPSSHLQRYQEYRKAHPEFENESGDINEAMAEARYLASLVDTEYAPTVSQMKGQNIATAMTQWLKAVDPENEEYLSTRIQNAQKIYQIYTGIGHDTNSLAVVNRDAARVDNSDMLGNEINEEAVAAAQQAQAGDSSSAGSSGSSTSSVQPIKQQGIIGSISDSVGNFFAGIRQAFSKFTKIIGKAVMESPLGNILTKIFGDNAMSRFFFGDSMKSSSSSAGNSTTTTSSNSTDAGKLDPDATVADAPVSGTAGQAMVDMFNLGPDVITSPYGPRGGRIHAGVDYGVAPGTPVPTPVDGVIDGRGFENAYGNFVVVKDKKGYYHIFAHLNDNNRVKEKQQVVAGTIIAMSGSTGVGTGPHLHYGIYDPSHPQCANSAGSVDPMTYSIEGLSSKLPTAGKGLYGRKYYQIKTKRTDGTDDIDLGKGVNSIVDNMKQDGIWDKIPDYNKPNFNTDSKNVLKAKLEIIDNQFDTNYYEQAFGKQDNVEVYDEDNNINDTISGFSDRVKDINIKQPKYYDIPMGNGIIDVKDALKFDNRFGKGIDNLDIEEINRRSQDKEMNTVINATPIEESKGKFIQPLDNFKHVQHESADKKGKGYKIHTKKSIGTDSTSEEMDYTEISRNIKNIDKLYNIATYKGSKSQLIQGNEPISTQRNKYEAQKKWVSKNDSSNFVEKQYFKQRPITGSLDAESRKITTKDIDKMNNEELRLYTRTLNLEGIPIYDQPKLSDTNDELRRKAKNIASKNSSSIIYGKGVNSIVDNMKQDGIWDKIPDYNKPNFNTDSKNVLKAKLEIIDNQFDTNYYEQAFGKQDNVEVYNEDNNINDTISGFSDRVKDINIKQPKYYDMPISTNIQSVLTRFKNREIIRPNLQIVGPIKEKPIDDLSSQEVYEQAKEVENNEELMASIPIENRPQTDTDSIAVLRAKLKTIKQKEVDKEILPKESDNKATAIKDFTKKFLSKHGLGKSNQNNIQNSYNTPKIQDNRKKHGKSLPIIAQIISRGLSVVRPYVLPILVNRFGSIEALKIFDTCVRYSEKFIKILKQTEGLSNAYDIADCMYKFFTYDTSPEVYANEKAFTDSLNSKLQQGRGVPLINSPKKLNYINTDSVFNDRIEKSKSTSSSIESAKNRIRSFGFGNTVIENKVEQVHTNNLPTPKQDISIYNNKATDTMNKEQLEKLIKEQQQTNNLLAQLIEVVINNGKNFENVITNNSNKTDVYDLGASMGRSSASMGSRVGVGPKVLNTNPSNLFNILNFANPTR